MGCFKTKSVINSGRDTNLLKFTFSLPTFNASKYLKRCLKSIKDQNYPTTLVEIIVPDGGSSDNTIEIATSFGAQIFNNDKKLADYGAKISANNGTGDLFVVFAADNELVSNDWMKKANNVFLNHPDVSVIWGPMIPHESDSSINKYYCLIQSDPFCWFINNNLNNYINNSEHIVNGEYEIIKFNLDLKKPLVWGANGIIYRYDLIKDILSNSEYVADNDLFQLLMEHGHNTIAYVPSLNIYHHSFDSVSHWINKMIYQRKNHLLNMHSSRNLNWLYVNNFKIKSIIWFIYSLFIPLSVIHTFYLIWKSKNWYWVYHPLMSFIQAFLFLTFFFSSFKTIRTMIRH